ncbi:MAG: NifU family protein [Gemmatimonadaceae bacterium]
MATTTRRSELEGRIEHIDEMVQRLEEAADPVIRATARELVQSLMALHGAALERIVEVIEERGTTGQAMMDQLGRDELVRSVLVLYELHPVDVETRVREALEKSRPYLKSHGGNVELVAVDEGDVVRLRMRGSCHGCPSSSLTLKMTIEDAIREAAPEVTEIVIVDAEPKESTRRSLPLAELVSANGNGHGAEVEAAWEEVTDMERLATPGLHVVSMAGHEVLFCRLTESLYAYDQKCPACGGELGNARLVGRQLTCSQCGDSYDVVKAGRGINQPAYHLQPFPLLVEDGRGRVALPMTRAAVGVQ